MRDMAAETLRPLIGVPACSKQLDGHGFHAVGDKYARAVAVAADGLPMLIPAMPELVDIGDLVGRLDGLMLTGSPSNVHPEAYGRPADGKAEPHDRERDGITLPLIRSAIERGLPLLAICRGMQELNVALGGSLHPRIHEVAGRLDHRRPQHQSIDVQYGPRHSVSLASDGMLARLLDRSEIDVNSLHGQGIDRLAPALKVEATAPDGTVEAVSLPGAESFLLGVQWHPEYKVERDAISSRLFAAFGTAARARAEARRRAPEAARV